MTGVIESIGRGVFQGLSSAGRGMLLLRSILLATGHVWKMRREILEQMHVVLVGSMPLVIVTSVFVGAVTAVQAVYQMQAYVPMKFLGTVISKSVFIELGPVLMALVVGSRLCAYYAAELGTMKVTEQLDAMNIMAIDPVQYLAMPRFWASVLMIPLPVLVVAMAILYGPWAGFAGALAGSVLGACAGYGIGRAIWPSAVQRLAGRRLHRLLHAVERRGLLATAVLRVVPVGPFTLVNLVSGSVRLRFRDFVGGNLIGLTPGVLLLTVSADRVVRAVRHPSAESITIALAVVVALVIGTWWLRKRLARLGGSDR